MKKIQLVGFLAISMGILVSCGDQAPPPPPLTPEEKIIEQNIIDEYKKGALPDSIKIDWIKKDSIYTTSDSISIIKNNVFDICQIDSSRLSAKEYIQKCLNVVKFNIDTLKYQYESNIDVRDTLYDNYIELKKGYKDLIYDPTGLGSDFIALSGGHAKIQEKIENLKNSVIQKDETIKRIYYKIKQVEKIEQEIKNYFTKFNHIDSKPDSSIVLVTFYSAKHLVRFTTDGIFNQEYRTYYLINNKGKLKIINVTEINN